MRSAFAVGAFGVPRLVIRTPVFPRLFLKPECLSSAVEFLALKRDIKYIRRSDKPYCIVN